MQWICPPPAPASTFRILSSDSVTLLYHRAIKGHYAWAQLELAMCYEIGIGYAQCSRCARVWYKKAASNKNIQYGTTAQDFARDYLKNTFQIVTHVNQLVSLYEWAIDVHRNPVAMYALGVLYKCGNGSLIQCGKTADSLFAMCRSQNFLLAEYQSGFKSTVTEDYAGVNLQSGQNAKRRGDVGHWDSQLTYAIHLLEYGKNEDLQNGIKQFTICADHDHEAWTFLGLSFEKNINRMADKFSPENCSLLHGFVLRDTTKYPLHLQYSSFFIQKSYKLGCSLGYYWYAWILQEGTYGVDKDVDKAEQLLLTLVHVNWPFIQHYPNILWRLGEIHYQKYSNVNNIDNFHASIIWWCCACNLGCRKAQSSLSVVLFNERDSSLILLAKVAFQNLQLKNANVDPRIPFHVIESAKIWALFTVMSCLGNNYQPYSNNNGLWKVNELKSVDPYENHSIVSLVLGIIYYYGFGVVRNADLATKYFVKAARTPLDCCSQNLLAIAFCWSNGFLNVKQRLSYLLEPLRTKTQMLPELNDVIVDYFQDKYKECINMYSQIINDEFIYNGMWSIGKGYPPLLKAFAYYQRGLLLQKCQRWAEAVSDLRGCLFPMHQSALRHCQTMLHQERALVITKVLPKWRLFCKKSKRKSKRIMFATMSSDCIGLHAMCVTG
jgi:TPR repeat protein